MTRLAETITANTAVFCAFSMANHIFISLICILAVSVVFRVSLRRHPLLWTAAGLLSIAVGIARPFCIAGSDAVQLIWEGLSLLQPFVCALLLVPFRNLLKGFAAALGYSLLELPKYLILMLCFHYNNNDPDTPAAFLVEFLLNLAFFLVFLVLYVRRERKKNLFAPFLRLDPVFFVLIVFSLGGFMASLVLFSSTFSTDKLPEFVFVIINIPLFAATVVYGVATTLRTKKAEETYRRELDRQILHYEAMERNNEDLRMFRHDLQKMLRPMVAYLDENNPAAAKEIAAELGAFTAAQGKRYRTGNYRLDTVLFCEQQTAQADGIQIVFSDDSRFPADGVAPEDIYTIFPNALDNAIEACRQMDGEREILVTAKTVGDDVFVTISNPIAGALNVKNGVLQTTKADKKQHGYGMRLIKKAAANYGADNVDHLVENGRFILRISLRYKNSFLEQ
ncbi:MAG: ATP-binding protein [Clostridia bacterium]|nr:ATP-binding protein [Clostridia bacterium]